MNNFLKESGVLNFKSVFSKAIEDAYLVKGTRPQITLCIFKNPKGVITNATLTHNNNEIIHLSSMEGQLIAYTNTQIIIDPACEIQVFTVDKEVDKYIVSRVSSSDALFKLAFLQRDKLKMVSDSATSESEKLAALVQAYSKLQILLVSNSVTLTPKFSQLLSSYNAQRWANYLLKATEYTQGEDDTLSSVVNLDEAKLLAVVLEDQSNGLLEYVKRNEGNMQRAINTFKAVKKVWEEHLDDLKEFLSYVLEYRKARKLSQEQTALSAKQTVIDESSLRNLRINGKDGYLALNQGLREDWVPREYVVGLGLSTSTTLRCGLNVVFAPPTRGKTLLLKSAALAHYKLQSYWKSVVGKHGGLDIPELTYFSVGEPEVTSLGFFTGVNLVERHLIRRVCQILDRIRNFEDQDQQGHQNSNDTEVHIQSDIILVDSFRDLLYLPGSSALEKGVSAVLFRALTNLSMLAQLAGTRLVIALNPMASAKEGKGEEWAKFVESASFLIDPQGAIENRSESSDERYTILSSLISSSNDVYYNLTVSASESGEDFTITAKAVERTTSRDTKLLADSKLITHVLYGEEDMFDPTVEPNKQDPLASEGDSKELEKNHTVITPNRDFSSVMVKAKESELDKLMKQVGGKA